MSYAQFTEVVKRHGWTIPELRCDVRPSSEILEFIHLVGDADYELFVTRLEATQ